MTLVTAIGHISRDVVAGAPPRPGGGVFYAARALARLGTSARIAASCADEDRPALLPPLQAFGLDVTWHESSTTTAYSFHYEGNGESCGRTRSETRGRPSTPSAQRATRRGSTSAHSHAQTSRPRLAALADEGRQLLVDAQGPVRTAAVGPLQTDGDIGDVLRYFEVLKLNDEEAETLVGSADPDGLRALGVPEVLLTLGSRGSWVITPELRRARAGGRDPRARRSDRGRGHVLRDLPGAPRRRRGARRGGPGGSRGGLGDPHHALGASNVMIARHGRSLR